MNRYTWVVYDRDDNAQYSERYSSEDEALSALEEIAYKFERDETEFGVRDTAKVAA